MLLAWSPAPAAVTVTLASRSVSASFTDQDPEPPYFGSCHEWLAQQGTAAIGPWTVSANAQGVYASQNSTLASGDSLFSGEGQAHAGFSGFCGAASSASTNVCARINLSTAQAIHIQGLLVADGQATARLELSADAACGVVVPIVASWTAAAASLGSAVVAINDTIVLAAGKYRLSVGANAMAPFIKFPLGSTGGDASFSATAFLGEVQCGAGAGCHLPHRTGGCADTACCFAVCDADPSCCAVEWDLPCASMASMLCMVPNDACGAARRISTGIALPFDTTGAETSGPVEQGCDFFGYADVYHDVWFKWTADCTGRATFSTCGLTDFDSKMAVYSGIACGSVEAVDVLACADDSPGCGVDASITVDCVLGNTYLIRVGGYANSAGVGQLLVQCEILNDECENATPIELGDEVAVNTTMATTGGPSLLGACSEDDAIDMVKDVWFVCTSTCDGTLVASTCDAAFFDTILAIYDGCPSAGGVLLACNDLSISQGCPSEFIPWQAHLETPATSGATYWIRLGGSTGPFTVGDIAGVATLSVTCKPANDQCLAASEVGVGQQPFSTLGATPSAPPSASCPNGSFSVGDDLWYIFSPTFSGQMLVSACGDTVIDFLDGARLAVYGPWASPAAVTCTGLSGALLNCDASNTNCADVPASVIVPVVEGNAYLIRVGSGFQQSFGGFWLEGNLSVFELVPGDIDQDGDVDGSDLGVLLAAWGPCPSGCAADINGDGVVDGLDLGTLLAGW